MPIVGLTRRQDVEDATHRLVFGELRKGGYVELNLANPAWKTPDGFDLSLPPDAHAVRVRCAGMVSRSWWCTPFPCPNI